MKKLIALTLSLLLALSLAACGGGSSNSGGSTTTLPVNSSTSAASQDADSNTPAPTAGESVPAAMENDAGSIAGFLSHYGLTEDDVKPEHFIEFGELTMDGKKKAGETGSMGFIKITVDKDATGEDQVKAWYEKLYPKLQTLSADGKLYSNVVTLDKEATLEALYENPLWEQFPDTMWVYRYNAANGAIKLAVSTSYDYETGIYKMSIGVFGG